MKNSKVGLFVLPDIKNYFNNTVIGSWWSQHMSIKYISGPEQKLVYTNVTLTGRQAYSIHGARTTGKQLNRSK